MIKSNELRIGNLVSRRGETSVVVSLDREDVWVRLGGEYGDFERWYFESIDPIPLTPEILEKCGFEEQMYSKGTWSCGEVSLLIRDFQPVTMGRDDYELFGKPLQYLHQLQNLVFALTGEELTKNEDHE